MAESRLEHIEGSAWFVPGPTNIGMVLLEDGVWLIDSGNDKDAGRKILKIIKEQGWTLTGIINTHSNADHIGANSYLQNQTGCSIVAHQTEAAFIADPHLEADFLYGGYAYRELRNKFFEAKSSEVTSYISPDNNIGPINFIPLPGHFFGMTGILIDNGVFFLGDALAGEHVLDKYSIPFIYDVIAYRKSIQTIAETEARFFIPSHGEITENIGPLAGLNLRRVDEIISCLNDMLTDRLVFDSILKKVCDRFSVSLDYAQYVLVGSTIRSFLSYLHNEEIIDFIFEDNSMYWQRK